MAFTDIERVRLLIGDRAAEVFTTAEIQNFLDDADDDVDAAALAAARAAYAEFATKADQTTGAISTAYSKRAEQYRQLVTDLGGSVGAGQVAPCYVGGRLQSEIDSDRANTSLTQPGFTRDLHEDGSTDPSDEDD